MNKEPIGLYIFRFVMGFGLFAFMCMLYWSSVLIEQDMKDLQEELSAIKNEISLATRKLQKARHTGLSPSQYVEPPRISQRPHIDDNLPNLLQEDPFYKETLPKLLGSNFSPDGTFRSSVLGRPDSLNPFSAWANVAAWNALSSTSVAKMQFGKYETFAPNMALKVEERRRESVDAPEYWIHLREGVFWKPLQRGWFPDGMELAPQFFEAHPVTAEDFKFYFDALMNPFIEEAGAVSLRNYLGDIESIEVIDPLTFVVRWKVREIEQPDGTFQPRIKYVAKQWTGALKPLPSFIYKYFQDGSKIVEEDQDLETYRTNSVWAHNMAQHWARNIIVSCGPWTFNGMTDEHIQFNRNQHFFFPLEALTEKRTDTFRNSPDAIWQDFKTGQIETYGLRPDQLVELEEFLQSPLYKEQETQGKAIERIDYLGRQYNYIGWNQARPFFKSKRVRQALTMAIDRKRIIEQYMNGLAIEIHGSFSPDSPSYDHSIESWPFNPLKAKMILAQEGWFDSDGDGIIDKEIDGKKVPFEFSLTYFVKSPTIKSICEYIATALKELGIRCHLNGVDIADLTAVFDDKNFDALSLAWGLGTPPENPKQLWYSAGAKEKGSSNAVGFVNQEADQIIEQLEYENDPKKRIQLYHRFDAILHEEQPYTFLFAPKAILLYREKVQNVFIPSERQDLIPGANVAVPDSDIFWLKHL